MGDLLAEFKKVTGLRTEIISEETGYTRQGVAAGFRQIEQEGKSSKHFQVAIQNLIARVAREEMDRTTDELPPCKSCRRRLRQNRRN
jgi:hypothetical protein